MTQWVQHISGQGEKWEVSYDDKHTSQWGVQVGTGIRQYYHWLPKSEYRLCEPPEVWVDVTDGVTVQSGRSKTTGLSSEFVYHGDNHLANLVCGGNYRLRKIAIAGVNGSAFIVERKQS
ncbi:MAG: hypothetical protein ABT940_00535 [Alphaproteobacteria bacterium]